jgi:hypothetical protein
MIYNYISVKEIVEGLYRDYGSQEELDLWDLIEWCGEALDLIGAHTQYVNIVEDWQVCDYRYALPCNLISINQISYKGFPLKYAAGIFGPADSTNDTKYFLDGEEVTEENYPLSETETSTVDYRYYINDAFLVSSFEEGCLTVSYTGTKVDEDGFPMIPDEVTYKKALKSYCQMMLDRKEWRRQRLSEAVYRDSQRDWEWYVRTARGKAQMPNIDKMESIKNQWVKLKPNQNSHSRFFSDLNAPERKKLK